MLSSRTAGAKKRLMGELAELQKEKWVNIDLIRDNILRWDIGLIVINEESAFNGAYLKVTRPHPLADKAPPHGEYRVLNVYANRECVCRPR
jgi:hypothetical protein